MLLIKPFLGCNMACKYCYERDYRKKHKPKLKYNLKDILKRMEEFKNLEMSLHGGEPLVLPKKDVEKIFKKMVKLTGRSGIQTNGTLIDDDYIKIFKKYKTAVGVSYDGPGILSEFRPGTANVDKTIKKLRKRGINASVIMVISRANAGTKKRLEMLKKYILELDKMGIAGRLNPCLGAPKYELSEKKIIEVYLDLARFLFENNLKKWSPFIDIVYALQGKGRVCTFMGCDPFYTPSATVVVNDGSISVCMRINQDEILLRDSKKYNTRDEILQETPQKFGGCKDCEYWSACHGGCPSGAINGDWRNRTYLCSLWKALFEYYGNILKFVEYPGILSVKDTSCPSRKEIDGEHQDQYCDSDRGDETHGDSHGDGHGDSHGDGHGDSHGDAPHGDAHGDAPHGDSN